MRKEEIISSEKNLINAEKTIVSNKINRVVSDLLYISDTLQISDFSGGNYEEVAHQWLAFSNRKKIYDQIRFIDVEGNEAIRVNYYQDGAAIVEKSNLQNKKDRFYFKDTILLKENQIYISELDLNIENNKIEQPIKPMIRLSKPYYSQDGELAGIIILNYLADDILQQIKAVASTSRGSIFMLNSDGYWLYNSENSSKEWAFMYQDRINESLKNEKPDEWQKIISNGKGSLISSNGVFNYTNILTNDDFTLDSSDNSLVLGLGDSYIVSYIYPNTQNGELFTNSKLETMLISLKKNYIAYLFILLIATVLAVLLTINKIENDRVKYFSEYDVMTGVYNRRAGFEKLAQLYKNCSKNNCKTSVCFIDINGLKQVNDYLGHDAGDELIISVVNGIKNSIRSNDFIARLGGDEFLIIFEGLDEDGSETIWKRIVDEYEYINNNENRKYIISASHGIESFNCNSNNYIDEIINHADEKMYNEKRMIKKDLKVIREI